ncbi:MAG TPA: flagellar motor switch protein FliG [Desulfomicrobiaceae bacterium]|nr:flagellar motor switch protein FliG [Desulfomicrobiaceae bacterium]
MQVAKMSGVEKAAVLLLCLGEEAAASVFEELSDTEVRMISRCMRSINYVPVNAVKEIMVEFQSMQKQYAGLFVKGGEFIKAAIEASPDKERVTKLLDQVSSSSEGSALETISMMQPRLVARLVEEEHPQTIALILSTQSPDHSARILNCFSEELKGDVVYRIATLDRVSPDVIAQIEEALQAEIGGVVSREQQQVGGVDKVVEVLARMDQGSDQVILDHISESNPKMAEEIRQKMLTFEDLADLDSRSLQVLLREVSTDQLTLALRSASKRISDKIYGNISERAAQMIQEDLDVMGPVRLSEVETVRQAIVKIALSLEEQKKIVIPGRGAGGDILV